MTFDELVGLLRNLLFAIIPVFFILLRVIVRKRKAQAQAQEQQRQDGIGNPQGAHGYVSSGQTQHAHEQKMGETAEHRSIYEAEKPHRFSGDENVHPIHEYLHAFHQKRDEEWETVGRSADEAESHSRQEHESEEMSASASSDEASNESMDHSISSVDSRFGESPLAKHSLMKYSGKSSKGAKVLDMLSPLSRAIVWADILGKPRGSIEE